MSHRLPQISEAIHRELSRLIRIELEPPEEILVTITGVDVSVDLQHAIVLVSVLPAASSHQTVAWLHRHARRLQAALFSSLHFRPIPALHFRSDDSSVQAAEVEELLDRIARPEEA